jgi:hypothetical protein
LSLLICRKMAVVWLTVFAFQPNNLLCPHLTSLAKASSVPRRTQTAILLAGVSFARGKKPRQLLGRASSLGSLHPDNKSSGAPDQETWEVENRRVDMPTTTTNWIVRFLT